jgi:hypothetical protein
MQSRQMGKTQTVASYILYYIVFNSNKTVALLANKAKAAREIMSRIQLMFESLPAFLQQGVKTYNKGDIELENGSKVFTGATTSSGIRGTSINLLYIDEFSIVSNKIADDFLASTYPTISSGKTTKIIITSTPLGLNHFWKFWNEAENGINDFVPIRVHWNEHPKRDQAWADTQRKVLGDTKFNQEVECDFIGSSHTLLNTETLRWLTAVKPIYSFDGLDVFNRPSPNRIYVLVADVSKGVGGDYSAFQIIDITELPYKQVAKYRDNKISPQLYPNVIHRVAREYNNAFVLIEINISEQVPYILYNEFEYENIVFVSKTQKGQQISTGFSRGQNVLGVYTDKKVKRIGCSGIKNILEERKLILQDSDTIAEFSNFIESKNSYEADDGFHDDLVMPLVLFAWMTNCPAFKDMSDVNLREEMYRNRIQEIEDNLLPAGFFNDGTETIEDSLIF